MFNEQGIPNMASDWLTACSQSNRRHVLEVIVNYDPGTMENRHAGSNTIQSEKKKCRYFINIDDS